MSLLLVSNDINHHGNFKGKSRVTRENSKSPITLLCLITPHADNLGPITRHGKPLYHPVIEEEAMSLLYLRLFSLELQPIFIRLMLLIQDHVA